jgi:hypothetical protein
MYPNLIQPLLDWTNANAEMYARFTKSRDIAELTRSTIENNWRFIQETLARLIPSDPRVTESNPFAAWTQAYFDNLSRFVQDCSRSLAAVGSETQAQFRTGMEEATRRLQEAANTTRNVISAAADETAEGVKASAEEVAEQAHEATKGRGGRHR